MERPLSGNPPFLGYERYLFGLVQTPIFWGGAIVVVAVGLIYILRRSTNAYRQVVPEDTTFDLSGGSELHKSSDWTRAAPEKTSGPEAGNNWTALPAHQSDVPSRARQLSDALDRNLVAAVEELLSELSVIKQTLEQLKTARQEGDAKSQVGNSSVSSWGGCGTGLEAGTQPHEALAFLHGEIERLRRDLAELGD